MRKGWERWDCSTWSREGSGGSYQFVFCIWMKEGCIKDRARLCSVVPSETTRGNGHKLKHWRLPLNFRKDFFTLRVMEHWHRSFSQVVVSPTLDILKSHQDTVLGSWRWPCSSRRLDQVTSRGPFQPQPFCDPVQCCSFVKMTRLCCILGTVGGSPHTLHCKINFW